MLIGVLGGGETERQVSLSRVSAVKKALNALGYESVFIDCPKDLHLLKDCSFVFNLMHGGEWEGGLSQKILETLCVPHSSTTSFSAKVLMDKALSLKLAKYLKVKHPPFRLIGKEEYLSYNHFPHIIKTPKGSGSSLGTNKICSKVEQLDYFLNMHEEKLMLEFIYGLGYSCAVYNGHSLGACMIRYDGEFCSYEIRYNPLLGLFHSPVPDNLRLANYKAQKAALTIYKALKCKGLVRFDFMIDYITKEPYFLEANPCPGMTDVSIAPDTALFTHGLTYLQLINGMITGSLLKTILCK